MCLQDHWKLNRTVPTCHMRALPELGGAPVKSILHTTAHISFLRMPFQNPHSLPTIMLHVGYRNTWYGLV